MSEKHTHDHCRFDDAEESLHKRIFFNFRYPAQPAVLVDLTNTGQVAHYQVQNTGLKAFYAKSRETSALLKLKPGDDPFTFHVDWKLIIYPVYYSQMEGWFRYVGNNISQLETTK